MVKIKSFNYKLANKIHNNFYDYSKVKYVGNEEKVIIICPKHGKFLQSPLNHITKQNGCRICGIERQIKKQTYTLNWFITEAKKIHGTNYDYSLSKYVNTKTKLIIVCRIHGKFKQQPEKHIHEKNGCPKCRSHKTSLRCRHTTAKFFEKASKIHKNKYDYSLVKYKTSKDNVIIICKNHGQFKQAPSNHLAGKGCSKCSHIISKQETMWLNSLKIPNRFRQKTIIINNKRYKVGAYNEKTKTIYEFFGFFWHGHPKYYNKNKLNPINKKKYGDLYKITLNKIKIFKKNGIN